INNTAYDEPLEDFVIREKEVLNTIFQFPAYKAPGPSGVINAAIEVLGHQLAPIITNSVNASLRLGHYPSGWKHSMTVVIRKPGKPDYTVPKAYRPIALEEALSSVCEAVLSCKLSQLAENANLLPQMQFGARSGRTTTDAILSLTKWTREVRGKTSIYGVTNLGRVSERLESKGEPSTKSPPFSILTSLKPSLTSTQYDYATICDVEECRQTSMVNLISNFLEDRTTRLVFDDHKSDTFEASNGFSQGSALSPLLYNFYTADLLDIAGPSPPRGRPRALVCAFVNDTSLAVSSPSFKENVEMLEALAPRAVTWGQQHTSQFDPNKFTLVHILTKQAAKTKPDQTLPVKVGDVTIKPVESARLLGVTIDRHLD
ncbi:hypothetical protein PIIN_11026, partial [Serendipita indica DSM 11827]